MLALSIRMVDQWLRLQMMAGPPRHHQGLEPLHHQGGWVSGYDRFQQAFVMMKTIGSYWVMIINHRFKQWQVVANSGAL